jgi:hypothetical protein
MQNQVVGHGAHAAAVIYLIGVYDSFLPRFGEVFSHPQLSFL